MALSPGREDTVSDDQIIPDDGGTAPVPGGDPAAGDPAGGGPSRRGLLKAGLAAGAVAGAGGWRAAPGGHPRHRLRKPNSLPYPHLPPGTDTIPQIEHIVVLMMENHSYDNRLGMLNRHGADGFRLGHDGLPTATNPYANGDLQHAFRMPTTCQLDGKPAQDWLNSHLQFNHGRNDGFVQSGSGPVSMGYWQQADQPFYDSLDKAGISWRDYYTTLPTTLLYPQLYIKNHGTKVIPVAQFFTDAAAGKLPGFCMVEPDYGNQSEENPQNIASGEQFAAQVVNAVMAGPGWRKTLLIWNYDEHGGYYDHVTPPPAIAPDNIPPAVPAGQSAYNGFRQYGFRVPCVLVSPWSRPRHVSHRLFDHTSICALVEAKWNLPALTYRDANASNMLDMLDLRHPTFLTPPALARPLLDIDPGALACNTSGPGTIPPPGSVTPPHHHHRPHPH